MKKNYSTLILFCFILLTLPNLASAESDTDFLLEQGAPPPGANDPACEPSEDKPKPIILVPGTFERSAQNWAELSPMLAGKGNCVYALNYGFTHAGASTGPIEESAQELKDFIDNVLQLTEAEQVDIIGHSQGGMMPRYYIKNLGGAKHVDNLIALVPSNHGTVGFLGFHRLTDDVSDMASCIACQQQLVGSEFLENLIQGDETPGQVDYTVITTKTDEVVIPYSSAFIEGPSTQVSNITIQDYYPLNMADHQAIAYDPLSFKFVFDALAHEGPADPERAVQSIY
ncbi:esterase/lipase family protein [Thalassobacillus devorans]|uniref:esterase/lipase family protein n=1 Tax=Thalassobacillus devorans TaxID=279813 RepID=UPI0004B2116B|nr:alpha/beta fold hydrolase [Thalassobacillus devorans]